MNAAGPYSRVLDDPLSALDAHVAKELVGKCIQGAFKEKAVLLVTHQLQFAHTADHIVVMSQGAVAERGTYADLVAREGGTFKAGTKTSAATK
jgi:ABC-type multidrug transport system fused ATPase/permease subunit